MSNDEESMYCEAVSEEEVERRKAMLAEFYASNILPPLYRLSTMAEDVSWGTAVAGAPPASQSRFIFEADTPPGHRFEVHTLEFGDVEELKYVPWTSNFACLPPEAPLPPVSVPVTIGTVPESGKVLASTTDGWLVFVEGANGTFLIIGPGELPDDLSLVRVQVGMPAL